MPTPLAFRAGPFVNGSVCVVCGKTLHEHAYVCPDHGQEGILDIQYDHAAAAPHFPDPSQPGMWRYRALFPLPLDAPVPPLLTGMTPFYDSPALARHLGLSRVFLKDDSRQPTASFKDRASALAVAIAADMAARDNSAPVIATASTGNAAAALAGMSAAAGVPCVIFVPAAAPAAKIAQLQAYGARIFLVQGSYDQAFELCMSACARMGWYNRNTAYNPCMAEGKKSAAFEIAEQMNWNVPDALFLSVGDGCILAGIHKGFRDLLALGRISRMPRLYGVQAAGSDFMVQAQEEELFSPQNLLEKAPIAAHTRADSISAGLPRDRIKAMNAVRHSHGAFLRVSDEEILAAIPLLARLTGVFAEPAAAAALAGLLAGRHFIAPDESVCLLITGSGLKDVAAASSLEPVYPPLPLEASEAALTAALAAFTLNP